MYTLISKFHNQYGELQGRLNYTLIDTISCKTYILWEEQLEELIKNGIEIDNYEDRHKLKEFALIVITTEGNSEIILDSVMRCNYKKEIKFTTDTVYVKQVADMYRKYIDSCKIIGKNNEFKYIIKGDYVVLKEYLGDQEIFVVPDFIDAIGSSAEKSLKNVEVRLQEGIQFIGVREVNIESIPKSVKLFSIKNSMQPKILSDDTIRMPHRKRE